MLSSGPKGNHVIKVSLGQIFEIGSSQVVNHAIKLNAFVPLKHSVFLPVEGFTNQASLEYRTSFLWLEQRAWDKDFQGQVKM